MPVDFNNIKEIEETFQLNTYKKLPISIEKGEGVFVFDSEGNRYLDLYGGHAVALTGHSHPRVVEAVKEQVSKLIFYSNVVYSSVRAEASRAVIEIAPQGIDKVFFCNSGAEANETALKIARRYTGKKTVIAMKNGFHGRTIGALSATGLGNYRKQFSPLIEDFKFVEFGKLKAMEKAISDRVGGVILEPVQSMAGVEMADENYYKGLRKLCTEKGIVLIFDEVQTGFGRTGSWFFGDSMGVVPDIITLAKGIGGGIPVGGVLIHQDIAKTISPGEHGSTFGGGPVACAAVAANIKLIKDENLVENARKVGSFLKSELEKLGMVKKIRGRGLLLGVEIEGEAAKLRNFLLSKGIITGTSSLKNVLRLLPPLILKEKHVELLIDALKKY